MVYTCRSAGHIEAFRKLVKRMIPIDNRMRWNGWYNMLEVLLNLRPYVEKYCLDYEEELEADILTF